MYLLIKFRFFVLFLQFLAKSGNCSTFQSYASEDTPCTYCFCFPDNWYNCWTKTFCSRNFPQLIKSAFQNPPILKNFGPAKPNFLSTNFTTNATAAVTVTKFQLQIGVTNNSTGSMASVNPDGKNRTGNSTVSS